MEANGKEYRWGNGKESEEKGRIKEKREYNKKKRGRIVE